jgi:hypothetical protein
MADHAGGAVETVEAADGPEPMDGIPFSIPFMCAINTPTGDGRTFEQFDLAPLPWPLATQFQRTPGHDGADISGKITKASIDDQGVVSGEGVYLLTDDGVQAAQLAANEAMPGFSIDADEAYEMSLGEDGTRTYHRARIRGGIQLQMPAFAQAKIVVDPAAVEAAVQQMAANAEVVAHAETIVAAMTRPRQWAPPAAFFNDPGYGDTPESDPRLHAYPDRSGKLAGYHAPFTISPDGHVEGHIAPWNMCHTGYTDRCVRPPVSAMNYAYFHRGEVEAANGEIIPVGNITFEAAHASDGNRYAAQEHYDNSALVAAYGRVGEDKHGVWFSGVLRPDLTAAQRATFQALGPSGDWRREGGALELVACTMVPVQGYPHVRTWVADGKCQRLVASGGIAVAGDHSAELAELRHRIALLEGLALTPEVLAARTEAALAVILAE